MQALRHEEHHFRHAPQDEAELSTAAVAERLQAEFVVGVLEGDALVGVAGLTRFQGTKLRHKALLSGMYVEPRLRGAGAANMLNVGSSPSRAGAVEMITLTGVARNARAVQAYERWGFKSYGTEPASIKLADGKYLDETLMALRPIP